MLKSYVFCKSGKQGSSNKLHNDCITFLGIELSAGGSTPMTNGATNKEARYLAGFRWFHLEELRSLGS